MSYGNEEASTHRRDARPVLAPETLEDSVHARERNTEPPTRLRANATPAHPFLQRSAVQPHVPHAAPAYGYEQPSFVAHAPRPQRTAPQAYEQPSYVAHAPQPHRSVPQRQTPQPQRHAPQAYEQPSYVAHAFPDERTEPSIHAMQPAIAPLPRTRRSTKKSVDAPHPADLAAARRSTAKIATEAKSSSSSSRSASSSSSGSSSRPTAKVPPELAPTIYSWVRRLALQADLPTADRVLRDALLEITSSLAASFASRPMAIASVTSARRTARTSKASASSTDSSLRARRSRSERARSRSTRSTTPCRFRSGTSRASTV